MTEVHQRRYVMIVGSLPPIALRKSRPYKTVDTLAAIDTSCQRNPQGSRRRVDHGFDDMFGLSLVYTRQLVTPSRA
jgi:hypothetical protein